MAENGIESIKKAMEDKAGNVAEMGDIGELISDYKKIFNDDKKKLEKFLNQQETIRAVNKRRTDMRMFLINNFLKAKGLENKRFTLEELQNSDLKRQGKGFWGFQKKNTEEGTYYILSKNVVDKFNDYTDKFFDSLQKRKDDRNSVIANAEFKKCIINAYNHAYTFREKITNQSLIYVIQSNNKIHVLNLKEYINYLEGGKVATRLDSVDQLFAGVQSKLYIEGGELSNKDIGFEKPEYKFKNDGLKGYDRLELITELILNNIDIDNDIEISNVVNRYIRTKQVQLNGGTSGVSLIKYLPAYQGPDSFNAEGTVNVQNKMDTGGMNISATYNLIVRLAEAMNKVTRKDIGEALEKIFSFKAKNVNSIATDILNGGLFKSNDIAQQNIAKNITNNIKLSIK